MLKTTRMTPHHWYNTFNNDYARRSLSDKEITNDPLTSATMSIPHTRMKGRVCEGYSSFQIRLDYYRAKFSHFHQSSIKLRSCGVSSIHSSSQTNTF
jgi:hypothetical protein